MKVINLHITPITFSDSLLEVIKLAKLQTPSYVCFANVHMIVEAYKDAAFKKQVNNATMVLADGKPVAVACKWLNGKKQERIAGMNFMPCIIEAAEKTGTSIFLYGSTEEVLIKLKAVIQKKHPNILIKGMISPPFRTLTSQEKKDHLNIINTSGAQIVLVSLGCPKQEKWMADNYTRLNAVLLGVGGAFTVMAGLQKRAPEWMQHYGLEWLHRLMQEPGRLFKRYFVTNSIFILLLTKSLLKKKYE
jgi:N-acetylglucosaminyldiphosphoundecaprenol N-acetyl-beta-D-mannosaminyltransferase